MCFVQLFIYNCGHYRSKDIHCNQVTCPTATGNGYIQPSSYEQREEYKQWASAILQDWSVMALEEQDADEAYFNARPDAPYKVVRYECMPCFRRDVRMSENTHVGIRRQFGYSVWRERMALLTEANAQIRRLQDRYRDAGRQYIRIPWANRQHRNLPVEDRELTFNLFSTQNTGPECFTYQWLQDFVHAQYAVDDAVTALYRAGWQATYSEHYDAAKTIISRLEEKISKLLAAVSKVQAVAPMQFHDFSVQEVERIDDVAVDWLFTLSEVPRFARLSGQADPIITRIGDHAHPGELYLDAHSLSVEEINEHATVREFFQQL